MKLKMRTVSEWNEYEGIYYFECVGIEEALYKVEDIKNIMDSWILENVNMFYEANILQKKDGSYIIQLKIFKE